MSAYDTLLAAMDATKMDQVIVMRIDLAELLAEVDSLRTGGATKPATKYSAEFEEAWTLYPARPGASKAAAFKAWSARLKAGATALEMIAGTAKYAAYVKAERTEAHFIKQAATFYGPGEHFSADWTPRRPDTGGQLAGAGRPPRGPAPETDDERAARRSRWGIPGVEGNDAPY
ncbi:MAG: hypothetical protein V4631_22210 [Pseudomonadota bacterium]